MAFTYTARLRIRPEKEAAFRAALDDMIAVARTDPGTLDYKVFTLDDPYCYVFYESYVDAAADERHRTDPVSGAIVQRLVDCIDGDGFSQEFWTPVASLKAWKA